MPRSSPLRNALRTTKSRDRVACAPTRRLGDREAVDVFCQTLDELAGRLNLEVSTEPEQSVKRIAKASHRKPKSAA